MASSILPLTVSAVLFALACGAHAQSNVFIIRHAEKAPARTADRNDPPLSQDGRSRAVSLARSLRDVPLTAIFVTEYKRTQQTAQAIARAAGVEPVVIPAKETRQLISSLNGSTGNVLVIGHSNTVPEILAALGAPQKITIADDEYDNLFIWTPASKQLLRLRY